MKFDLEDRIIKFNVALLRLTELMPDGKAPNYLSAQLVRSGTAPTLVYGEACAAESPQDFIHKRGVALKELKETRLCLKVIDAAGYYPNREKMQEIVKENEELIAIFGASINTARKKLK